MHNSFKDFEPPLSVFLRRGETASEKFYHRCLLDVLLYEEFLVLKKKFLSKDKELALDYLQNSIEHGFSNLDRYYKQFCSSSVTLAEFNGLKKASHAKSAKEEMAHYLNEDFLGSDEKYEKIYSNLITPEEYIELKKEPAKSFLSYKIFQNFLGADELYTKHYEDILTQSEYKELKYEPAILWLEKQLRADFLAADELYNTHCKELVDAKKYLKLKKENVGTYLKKILADVGINRSDKIYAEHLREYLSPYEYLQIKTPVERLKESAKKELADLFSKDYGLADEKYDQFYRNRLSIDDYLELKKEHTKTIFAQELFKNFLGADELYNKHYKDILTQSEYKELKRDPSIQWLEKQLEADFLVVDELYNTHCNDLVDKKEYLALKASTAGNYLTKVLAKDGITRVDEIYAEGLKEFISRKDFLKIKAPYLKLWFQEYLPKGFRPPDLEQLSAISDNLGHLIVVARAGSGKTTTLVYRAFYQIVGCGVKPSEILLLAFNKKAAEEIRERLTILIHGKRDSQEVQAGVTIPHVMTFHALAYAIVHPEEKLLFDEGDAGALGLSGAFQKLINNCLQEDYYRDRIRLLMFSHFKNDWERIIKGKYDKSQEEFLEYRRSLAAQALGGEYVKSYGEKVIANFLFEHDINYKYERNHWWSGINYRPDFTLFFDTPNPSGVIIEYFGLTGDVDYDEMSESKRKYWSEKKDWELIEFTTRDIPGGDVDFLNNLLKGKLEKKGFVCNRLSEEEIWTRVRDRFVTRFSKAVSSFVGRCRQKSLSVEQLNALAANHEPIDLVESRFLELAIDFYEKYLNLLNDTNEEDFNGLMHRAVEMIRDGNTKFDRVSESGDLSLLKFISIDEYQDFSELFHKLIEAIRSQNSGAKLFCVGDDWQAINGFAGSDLRFFKSFEQNFEDSLRLSITTNYRSSRKIVDCGNQLMEGLGVPAESFKDDKGEVLVCDLEEFEPSRIEKIRHQGDLMTPALLRIIHKGLSEDMDIVLLARRNGLPCYIHYPELTNGGGRSLNNFLDHVRRFFPEELAARIHISTSHKYKGLEKPMVIILDALENCYPLIHSDWVFSRIHGDDIEAIAMEERRLFYVALTRAISKLVIVHSGRSKTPFLNDINLGSRLNWDDYPPFQLKKSPSILVEVGNAFGFPKSATYQIKDLLKNADYRFNKTEWPHWLKSFPIKSFSIDQLKSEAWALMANGVEVRIVDEVENVKEAYLVQNQCWTKIKS